MSETPRFLELRRTGCRPASIWINPAAIAAIAPSGEKATRLRLIGDPTPITVAHSPASVLRRIAAVGVAPAVTAGEGAP